MPESKLYSDVLFIGNGINNINNSKSWESLVASLRKKVGKNEDAKDIIKQFPLLFENILNYGIRNGRIVDQNSLKKIVAQKVQRIKRNAIHDRIEKLSPANIITTNYDLVLEQGNNWNENCIIKESIFSIFRRQTSDTGRNIWYIHGRCLNESSINLGYEHYGGQLQQIRSFIIYGKKNKALNIDIKALRYRIGHLEDNPDSWIDLFFKSDIHIIGLSLDFIEIELWWLLAYRAKLLTKSKRKVFNNIYYYMPIKYLDDSKGKLELLHNFGINVRPLEGDKESYYNNVFDIVEGKTTFENKKKAVMNSVNRWLEEIIN